jgi:uroporphyrin-III C-methyltransferase
MSEYATPDPLLPPGTVHLVGAGPGDPELITLKALRLIRQADAVVYDYLVPPALLDEAPPGCVRIFAGKRAGHPCRPQSEIDGILVALARQEKNVVRLKGGDPFVFGRGGEEAETLAKEGIPFDIVPGVTAALGAAAFSGLPLTHRQHSSAIVFLTGHECPGKPEAAVRWEDYARLKATLCIYMGMHRLAAITGRLQDGGLSPDTPAVVIQAATTSTHREVAATLGTLAGRAQAAGISTPAIVIIGEVAAHRPGRYEDRGAGLSTEGPEGGSATETAAVPEAAGASRRA